jgi:predicted glycoside hydrolase/deacetylase ChbG (UPF0249 family)
MPGSIPANPVLKKLGCAESDRLAIIHVDDVGMCQASVAAFETLWEVGIVSSGAVMVPCPWFPLAANYARSHPQADLGVHATLTSEWQHYRWGPVSTREPSSGLLDEEGFFPHRSSQVQASASPEAAARELEAQVNRALLFGMHPTHFDTHMGSVAHPKFMESYLRLGMKYRLPLMVMRWAETDWLARGFDPPMAVMAAKVVFELESAGFPLLDTMAGLELDQPGDRLEQARQALSALKPGVTHFIIHAAKDTPELRAITPDWLCRVQDFETFQKEELRQFIAAQGIRVIGYRDMQNLIPS